MAPFGPTFQAPKGRLSRKREFFKTWWQSMAVGNCLQLSTGSGWDVLQWKGWARPEPRRGCAQACPGCSGFVHAWNGPQGAAVAWLCWRGARGEGLRGGFVSLLVPKGALMQTSFACVSASREWLNAKQERSRVKGLVRPAAKRGHGPLTLWSDPHAQGWGVGKKGACDRLPRTPATWRTWGLGQSPKVLATTEGRRRA